MINLFDYEAHAVEVLPPSVWDWIDGGAMDEVGKRRNRSALEQLTLRPRYLRDVRRRDLATTVLGEPVSMPVLISPAGLQTKAHPDGELATTRAAARSDVLMVAPTTSEMTLEEVRKAAPGPRWFQLYHHSRSVTGQLVERAAAAGYSALVLTVDRPISLPKERDVRNQDRPGADGLGLPGTTFRGANTPPAVTGSDPHEEGGLTWDELSWLRSVSDLPLVLKGIVTAEDGRRAVEAGVEGVFVSNHGARLFDAGLSSIEVLPEIVAAVDGHAEVYVDSGFRRGTDVLMALALGARAVGIGRPLFWGLAHSGEEGVHAVLELLRAELSRALASCGQSSVHDLGPGLVCSPPAWGPGPIR